MATKEIDELQTAVVFWAWLFATDEELIRELTQLYLDRNLTPYQVKKMFKEEIEGTEGKEIVESDEFWRELTDSLHRIVVKRIYEVIKDDLRFISD